MTARLEQAEQLAREWAEWAKDRPAPTVATLACELAWACGELCAAEQRIETLTEALTQIERGMIHSEYEPEEVLRRHRVIARAALAAVPAPASEPGT